MEAQQRIGTTIGQRRVEEARKRAKKAAAPVSEDRAAGKRRRKATPAEPAGPTFATATTLDELTQAAVADGARSAPPWRELIRWWRHQDALNKPLTTVRWGMPYARCLVNTRCCCPGRMRRVWICGRLFPAPAGRVDMMEYNRRWLYLPEPRPIHAVWILVDAWLTNQPVDRDRRRPASCPKVGVIPDTTTTSRYRTILTPSHLG